PADRQDLRRFRLPEEKEWPVIVDRGDQQNRGPRLGRQAMKIAVDTNVLVRAITGDDAEQSRVARRELAKADLVALALPALCELVWVLSQGYKVSSGDIAEAIRLLMDS